MPVWIIYLLLGLVAAGVIAAPLLWSKRSRLLAKAGADDAVDEPDPEPARPAEPGGASRYRSQILVGGGVAVVLVAAVALFVATGDKTPQTAAPPTGASGGGAGLPDVDTMIERLAKRLEAQPDDAEGWRMLGWSYFETRRYPEAVKAYAKAIALSPRDAGFQSAYGEAQVKAAGDVVTPSAARTFRAALAADAQDERARLYLARLKAAEGDSRGAVADLFDVLGTAAPDSRIAPAIRQEIRRIAAASGIDVTDRLPPEASTATAPGPSESDVAAAGQLPPDQQQAMVSGMVRRLENRLTESPRDADGWIMLMRSYKTLGQDGLARTARDKALEVFKDDPATRARLTASARDLGVS